MTAIIVLDTADDEQHRLRTVLRESGYDFVPVDGELVSDTGDLRARVTALVNRADDAQITRLETAVSAHADDLEEQFWGPSPDTTTATRAVYADLSDQFAQRRRLAAESISRDEAAELLGVSAQSVTGRLASGHLVGFKMGREWRLPAWQFDPDQPSGVLPGLQALQDAYPGGPIALSGWMFDARAEFDGRSARDEMVRHGSERVVELARSLTAAGW